MRSVVCFLPSALKVLLSSVFVGELSLALGPTGREEAFWLAVLAFISAVWLAVMSLSSTNVRSLSSLEFFLQSPYYLPDLVPRFRQLLPTVTPGGWQWCHWWCNEIPAGQSEASWSCRTRSWSLCVYISSLGGQGSLSSSFALYIYPTDREPQRTDTHSGGPTDRQTGERQTKTDFSWYHKSWLSSLHGYLGVRFYNAG